MFHSSITRVLLTSCLLTGGLACFGQTPDPPNASEPAPADTVPAAKLKVGVATVAGGVITYAAEATLLAVSPASQPRAFRVCEAATDTGPL